MLPIVTSRTNEVKKDFGELFEEINKVPWWCVFFDTILHRSVGN